MKKNDLITKEGYIVCSGTGSSFEQCITQALKTFRSDLNKEYQGVIIKIEPLEVEILRNDIDIKTEKFLGLFMPREKKSFSVELEIKYEVKYLSSI